MEYVFEHTSIEKIKDLLNDGYEVEIFSPDGYVTVKEFVDKGYWEEYILVTENNCVVRVNKDHLFETDNGWAYAKDLCDLVTWFVTEEGMQRGMVRKTGNQIPIVDVVIDHPNHRYYANGVSSHNTNVGKSLALVSLAADYIRDGLNVLYVSCEMREEVVFQRVDANILGLNMNKLTDLGEARFLDRIESLRSKSYGKLKVKEFPPTSATTLNIRQTMDEMKMKQGFIPDVIIVDYLQILASYRLPYSVGSYYFFKSVAEELRALAVETDTVVWSAAQFNRGQMNATDVDMSGIAESAGIAHTADGMWALIRTDELDQVGQLLVKQLKSRYANKAVKTTFTIGVNIENQTLYGLEDDRSTELTNMDSKVTTDQAALRDKFVGSRTSPASKFGGWDID